jgi:hypothetical protein
MVTSNSGRGKTPEEREHDDDIEQAEEPAEQEETEEENILRTQLGHVPGRLPRHWGSEATTIPGGREISLDHATDDEWEDFLKSLLAEEEE